MHIKAFLTLSLAGCLLAGTMVGSLVDGTDAPLRQGALLGFGLWLVGVGALFLRRE